jgi:hypothetical protein
LLFAWESSSAIGETSARLQGKITMRKFLLKKQYCEFSEKRHQYEGEPCLNSHRGLAVNTITFGRRGSSRLLPKTASFCIIFAMLSVCGGGYKLVDANPVPLVRRDVRKTSTGLRKQVKPANFGIDPEIPPFEVVGPLFKRSPSYPDLSDMKSTPFLLGSATNIVKSKDVVTVGGYNVSRIFARKERINRHEYSVPLYVMLVSILPGHL